MFVFFPFSLSLFICRRIVFGLSTLSTSSQSLAIFPPTVLLFPSSVSPSFWPPTFWAKKAVFNGYSLWLSSLSSSSTGTCSSHYFLFLFLLLWWWSPTHSISPCSYLTLFDFFRPVLTSFLPSSISLLELGLLETDSVYEATRRGDVFIFLLRNLLRIIIAITRLNYFKVYFSFIPPVNNWWFFLLLFLR